MFLARILSKHSSFKGKLQEEKGAKTPKKGRGGDKGDLPSCILTQRVARAEGNQETSMNPSVLVGVR